MTNAHLRTAAWVVTLLVIGLLFQQIRSEAHTRERDLCKVVVNVHRNAQFRAKTEHDQLFQTQKYLADTDPTESPSLYKRIKQNLPATLERVKVADGNVQATTVPPTCKPYQKGKS